MAVPKLLERILSELSKIQVRYFLGPSSRKPELEILVIKYAGRYPFGSSGNDDARYMYALAKAGVAAFEPWGVVHDLTELTYEWGDQLDIVFAVGPDEQTRGEEIIGDLFGPTSQSAVRPAIVVGPHCEEAVRTLLLGLNSSEPLEKVGYVFRQFESAWDFVDAQIK